MDGLLLKILPLALGAAISPMLLTVQIFILAGKRSPVLRSWAYTCGALLSLIAVTFIGASLFTFLHRHTGPNDVGGVIKTVAALLLLLLAVRAWRNKGGSARALQRRLDRAPTWEFLIVGVLAMILNFSSIVLFLPAVHEISHASVDPANKLTAYAVLVGITLLPALAPALLATLLGPKSDTILGKLNAFVTAHGNQINAAICLFFTVYLAIGAYKDFTGS